MSYSLLYSAASKYLIRKFHPEIKAIIRARLKRLKDNPYEGKPLERELSGYFSLRAKRYRIIYKINTEEQHIEIHYVGHRKDIYQLFRERA
ncbi:type II toxin-antitoxin system RelE/ParE family toxin [Thermodesulfobacteriota bacterium]